MNALLKRLAGGDRRSVGRVDEVVAAVRRDRRLFAALIEGMAADDEIIRMRAADAAEKLTVDHAKWLAPFKSRLLGDLAAIGQQEVRWHVAQMIPRLVLSAEEKAAAVGILLSYLDDKSNIVKVFSMQALADLAVGDTELRRRVVTIIDGMMSRGSPAVKSRGRRLLGKLR